MALPQQHRAQCKNRPNGPLPSSLFYVHTTPCGHASIASTHFELGQISSQMSPDSYLEWLQNESGLPPSWMRPMPLAHHALVHARIEQHPDLPSYGPITTNFNPMPYFFLYAKHSQQTWLYLDDMGHNARMDQMGLSQALWSTFTPLHAAMQASQARILSMAKARPK